MKIGLQIPSFTWPDGPAQIGKRLADIVQTADQGGFYSVWVMDHFFQIQNVGPTENDMLEGYSTLSYIAGLTKHVKLGTLVTGVIYRYPGLLVKTVSTLDVLSGGRAYLGIGAAWNERESLGLGVPFPPVAQRFEMLEEALQIAHQMWGSEVKPYQGKYNHLAEALNRPQPISQPHPPIMIGGGGEKKTLKLVAQYADACNLFVGMGMETLQARLNTLRDHCQAVGRDYNTIEKTALGTAQLSADGMTPDQVIAQLKELAGLGFTHIIYNMPNVADLTPLETFAKTIIPAVKDL